jgi:excisionase family DNA binding protein
MSTDTSLPLLLTVTETATLLRTTRKAVYAMIERDLLPGVTRIGRRVLVRSADLLDFLDHNRTPSPQAALYAPESGRARRGDSIAGTARGSG